MQANQCKVKFPVLGMYPFIKYPAYLKPYVYRPDRTPASSSSSSTSSSSSSSTTSSSSSLYFPQPTASLPSLKSETSLAKSTSSIHSCSPMVFSNQRPRRVGFQMDRSIIPPQYDPALHYQPPFVYQAPDSSPWLSPPVYSSENCRPKPILKRRVYNESNMCSEAIVYPLPIHPIAAPSGITIPVIPCERPLEILDSAAIPPERSTSAAQDNSSETGEPLPRSRSPLRKVSECSVARSSTHSLTKSFTRKSKDVNRKKRSVKRKKKKISMKMAKHEKMLLTKIETLLEKLASSPKPRVPEKQEEGIITMSVSEYTNQKSPLPVSLCHVRSPHTVSVPHASKQEIFISVPVPQASMPQSPLSESVPHISKQQSPHCVSVPQITDQQSTLPQSVRHQQSCVAGSASKVTNERSPILSNHVSPPSQCTPENVSSKVSLPPPASTYSSCPTSSLTSFSGSPPPAPTPSSSKAEDNRLKSFSSTLHGFECCSGTDALKLSIQEKIMKDLGKAAREELRKRAVLKIVELLFKLKVPGLREIVEAKGYAEMSSTEEAKSEKHVAFDKETESDNEREMDTESELEGGILNLEKLKENQKGSHPIFDRLTKKPWAQKPRQRRNGKHYEDQTPNFLEENVDTAVSKFSCHSSDVCRKSDVGAKSRLYQPQRRPQNYLPVCPLAPRYYRYPELADYKTGKCVNCINFASKPFTNHKKQSIPNFKRMTDKSNKRKDPLKMKNSKNTVRCAKDLDSSEEENNNKPRRSNICQELFSSHSLENYGLRMDKEKSKENKKCKGELFARRKYGEGSVEAARRRKKSEVRETSSTRTFPSSVTIRSRKRSRGRRSRGIGTSHENRKLSRLDRFHPDIWTTSALGKTPFGKL